MVGNLVCFCLKMLIIDKVLDPVKCSRTPSLFSRLDIERQSERERARERNKRLAAGANLTVTPEMFPDPVTALVQNLGVLVGCTCSGGLMRHH